MQLGEEQVSSCWQLPENNNNNNINNIIRKFMSGLVQGVEEET